MLVKARLAKSLCALGTAALPVVLYAFAEGPPIKRSGVPADGGLVCTACHVSEGPANSDPRGRFTIQTGPYTPGVKQTITVALVFAIMAYLADHVFLAEYLLLSHVPGTGELTVICGALIGGCMAFLWFNSHPAEVFMGDTGSLALGGLLGVMAFMIHQPLTLVIVGGVFVMELVSVVMQVGWFKFTKRRFGTGRRVFLMAPIHHHFQKLGWPEMSREGVSEF